jgi:hypothetical protein
MNEIQIILNDAYSIYLYLVIKIVNNSLMSSQE